MSRKQPKRRAGNMVGKAIAGIFISAVLCGVCLSVASADSSDDLARAGGFGFDAATQTATSATQEKAVQDESDSSSYYEHSALASPSTRTIDAGLKMIEEKEKAERERIKAEKEAERKRLEAERKAEQERIEAENAAALDRVKSQKEMQGVVVVEEEVVEEEAPEEVVEEEAPEEIVYEYNLPAVDWSVGQDEFIAEWTERIDAYLAGSALEGYGYAFAEAAWDNGVDPRWSPAIANTESAKGSVCFLPCNAWGWGQSSWSDWDTAIRAHVAGLAAGYGYCITPEAAAAYCPPNAGYWYSATIGEMACM